MTENEYQAALNSFANNFSTLRSQVGRIFELGRALGLNDMQIGNDVRIRIKGLVSTSTIQRMLPETAKHQEKVREPIAVKMNAPPGPNIPPPPQVIREAEEPEPPKAIEEPIHIPDHQITLNCRKFSTEIRMGLLNNATLKLTIDRSNQVTSIG